MKRKILIPNTDSQPIGKIPIFGIKIKYVNVLQALAVSPRTPL